jgi:hypothetical protein
LKGPTLDSTRNDFFYHSRDTYNMDRSLDETIAERQVASCPSQLLLDPADQSYSALPVPLEALVALLLHAATTILEMASERYGRRWNNSLQLEADFVSRSEYSSLPPPRLDSVLVR